MRYNEKVGCCTGRFKNLDVATKQPHFFSYKLHQNKRIEITFIVNCLQSALDLVKSIFQKLIVRNVTDFF